MSPETKPPAIKRDVCTTTFPLWKLDGPIMLPSMTKPMMNAAIHQYHLIDAVSGRCQACRYSPTMNSNIFALVRRGSVEFHAGAQNFHPPPERHVSSRKTRRGGTPPSGSVHPRQRRPTCVRPCGVVTQDSHICCNRRKRILNMTVMSHLMGQSQHLFSLTLIGRANATSKRVFTTSTKHVMLAQTSIGRATPSCWSCFGCFIGPSSGHVRTVRYLPSCRSRG